MVRSENSDGDSRHSFNQSYAKHKPIARSPAFSRVWACLLYSEYSLVFRAEVDRTDYFSFDLTIFDRKVLSYSSKGQAFDEEQDESTDSGEIEQLLRSRDQSKSYIGAI